MDSTKFFLFYTLLLLSSGQEWNYDNHGSDWDLGICQTGTQQSPIDITTNDAEDFNDNEAINIALNLFDFSSADMLVTQDDDYVYSFSRTSGGIAGSIQAMVKDDTTVYTFDMVSFQFKGTSEHEIDGKRYDMEMQILFQQSPTFTLDRPYAMLVVLFEEGDANDFLNDLAVLEVDWSELFDDEIEDYLYYQGSSTVPTCAESYNWYISTKVEKASQDQIDFYTGRKDAAGNNNFRWIDSYREQQLLNDRTVYQWGGLEDFEDFAGLLSFAITMVLLF